MSGKLMQAVKFERYLKIVTKINVYQFTYTGLMHIAIGLKE